MDIVVVTHSLYERFEVNGMNEPDAPAKSDFSVLLPRLFRALSIFGGIISAIAAIAALLQLIDQPVGPNLFRIGGPFHVGVIFSISAVVALIVAFWSTSRTRNDRTAQQEKSTVDNDQAAQGPGSQMHEATSPVLPLHQPIPLRQIIVRPSRSSTSSAESLDWAWLLLVIIVAGGLLYSAFSEYRKDQMILNDFNIVSGTVQLKETNQTETSAPFAFYIQYAFQPDSVSGRMPLTYTNRILVPRVLFDAMRLQQQVDVRYAVTDPSLSEIEGYHSSRVSNSIFLFGLGIAVLGYALNLIYKMWQGFVLLRGDTSSRSSTGGKIITGRQNKAGNYYVSFRFTANNQAYEIEQRVTQSDFDKLYVGTELDVTYVKSQARLCMASRFCDAEGNWNAFESI